MNARETYDQAQEDLTRFLDEYLPDEEHDAVLSVDTRKITDITITCGGPSVWIEYDHNADSATYNTTAVDYANHKRSGKPVQVTLSDDELNTLKTYLYLEDEF